jgi:hypothetical protein
MCASVEPCSLAHAEAVNAFIEKRAPDFGDA